MNNITREGVIKFQILAAITLLPSAVAFKQMWLVYLIVLAASFSLFFVLSSKYTLIAIQKPAFLQTQLVGFTVSLGVLLYPNEKILWCFLWLVFVIFRFLSLWNNALFEQLSSKKIDEDSQ